MRFFNSNNQFFGGLSIAFLVLFLFAQADYGKVYAQDRGNPGWYLRLTPYLWFSNIDTEESLEVGHGDHIVGDFFVPVGSSVLEKSWALRLEVGKRRIRGIINLSRANIKNPTNITNINDANITSPANYDFTWFTGEFFVAAQVGPFVTDRAFEIYVGGRYVNQQQDVIAPAQPDATQKVTETWFEPVLGGRLFAEAGNRFWAMFHTDIGGFTIGSDYTWTLGGELGFRLAKPVDITMRYNYQELQFDNGEEGRNRYIWDNGVQQGWFFGLRLKR